MKRAFALSLSFLSLGAAAGAQDYDFDYPGIEYFCTDKTGTRKELGETTCIRLCSGVYLARCEMSLNNAIWRQVEDGCPLAPAASLLERFERLEPGVDPLLVDPHVAIPVARAREDGDG